MAFFHIGCVRFRSFGSSVESQMRRAWLSAVMASLTCARRCLSVSMAPSLVRAIIDRRFELRLIRLRGERVRVRMVLHPFAP